MESLYDYGEEEQDFYEESPGTRKGYPIDHRSIKVSQYFDYRYKTIGNVVLSFLFVCFFFFLIYIFTLNLFYSRHYHSRIHDESKYIY